MATEITGDTPKYLTWREVLVALLRGDVVQYALKQDAENPSHLWSVVNPEKSFSVLQHCNVVYRIKPKPKVKKWLWVMPDRAGNLFITGQHYTGNEPGFNFIQKIDSTMIEVEE